MMEKIKLLNNKVFSILVINENSITKTLTITIPLEDQSVESLEKSFSNEENLSTITHLTAADEFMNSFRGYVVLGNTTKSNFTYNENIDEEIKSYTVAALTIMLEKQDLEKTVAYLKAEIETVNEILNNVLVTTLKSI